MLGDPPVPGDLWIAAAGEDDFGATDNALVLLLTVNADDRSALACPVTTVDAPGGTGSYRLDDTLLGIPLVVHSAARGSINFSVLNRRLGQGVEAFELAKLNAVTRGADVPRMLPTHANHDGDLALSSDALVATMTTLSVAGTAA